jgi:hypothetical protein
MMMEVEEKKKERTKEEKKKEEEGKNGECFWNPKEVDIKIFKKNNTPRCLVWFRLNGMGSLPNNQNNFIHN